MNENLNNKAYWNEYVTYWENRVNDTNKGVEKRDITSSDDILVKNLAMLELSEDDAFLDYGCGTCRIYEEYKRLFPNARNYYGVDISEVALEKAKKRFGDISDGHLLTTDGIRNPFNDNTFDKVFCYGVLDCCDQEKTISELIRVAKVDGLIWITGKNFYYYEDDALAYEAEIKARNNNFPNHFTKVDILHKQLLEGGVEIVKTLYFPRRGNAARFEYLSDPQDKFYEWAMLIRKKTNREITLSNIAFEYSSACDETTMGNTDE